MIITMRDCVLPLPLIIATSHHTIKFLITVTLLQLAMNIDLFSSLLHVNFAAALITQPTKEVNIIITSAWESSPVSVEHSTSHFLNKYMIRQFIVSFKFLFVAKHPSKMKRKYISYKTLLFEIWRGTISISSIFD